MTEGRLPDFSPLLSACAAIGPHLKSGAIVVFESTVYPGATEQVCIPELERLTGKQWKRDFFVGYSPERINPGDKKRTLRKIMKIVSGDTPVTLETLATVYGAVVDAGIFKAASMRKCLKPQPPSGIFEVKTGPGGRPLRRRRSVLPHLSG